MNSFPGQAILPGNVQRQREVVVVAEVEAMFATVATGFYFVFAAINYFSWVGYVSVQGAIVVCSLFSQAWTLCKGMP